MGGVHVSFDTLVASVPVADSRFESYYEGRLVLICGAVHWCWLRPDT